jgi:hypothetical protein
MSDIEIDTISVTDPDVLESTLADAKARFNRPPVKHDLATVPPLSPTVSDTARELQQLKAALHDAERTAMRAQKAASEYREQLQEAQADIAAMKTRWYAAEKARNAVSSQREIDSSTLQSQLVRAQRELERTQQLAQADMEKAAARIHSLEDRLDKALTNAAQAEHSKVRYRNRSNVSMALGISIAVVFSAILVYPLLPHPKVDLSAAPETASASTPGSPARAPRRVTPAIPLEAISQKPYVPNPQKITKSLPNALGNLDHALKALPGLDEQQVLEQISKKQSKPGQPVCQFAWSNGKPSMVFGGGSKGSNMENWAESISRCADAVEQSHE